MRKNLDFNSYDLAELTLDQSINIDGGDSVAGAVVDIAMNVLNSSPATIVAGTGLSFAVGLYRGFLAGIK